VLSQRAASHYDIASGKIAERDETEVTTGGSIQESAGIFAADVVAQRQECLEAPNGGDQRHVVVDLVRVVMRPCGRLLVLPSGA